MPQSITLNLSVEEVNFIQSVLGELPTKSGAWPLVSKIKEQAEADLAKQKADA